MSPVASPRHPFKALGVVIAMLFVVHGACAHVFKHHHDVSHVYIDQAAQVDEDNDDDGPDVDAHFGPNFPFDDDDTPARDPVEHDWD